MCEPPRTERRENEREERNEWNDRVRFSNRIVLFWLSFMKKPY